MSEKREHMGACVIKCVGFQSTKALGKWSTTTSTSKALPGIQVPNSKPVETKYSKMLHNEYIVYDEAQVHNR
jgi:hypothetical protein